MCCDVPSIKVWYTWNIWENLVPKYDQFDEIKFNAFVATKIFRTAQYTVLQSDLLPKISHLIKTRFTKKNCNVFMNSKVVYKFLIRLFLKYICWLSVDVM